MRIDYSRLPVSLQASARRYVESGWPPGGFLLACLHNDFVRAVGTADDGDLKRLYDISRWIYNQCPRPAWGSPKMVAAWIKSGGLEGQDALAGGAE